MRIKCPHCGERGNEEFAYLGDATVHPPDDASAATPDDRRLRALDGLRLPARQPRRRASRAVAARPWLPLLDRCDAKHFDPCDPRRGGRARGGDRPHRDRRRPVMVKATDLPQHAPRSAGSSTAAPISPSRSTGGPIPAIPAIRSPPRCWPTASGSSAARSSTIVRAAPVGRAGGAQRPRRAAERRAARTQHPRHRRRALRWAGSREPEPLAVAGMRRDERQPACRARSSRPGSTTRRSCGRLRSGRSCTSPSSAAPQALAAPRRRPIPTGTRNRPRICDVLVVGGGPAGLAGGIGRRASRRARHPRRRGFPAGWQAALREPDHRRPPRAGMAGECGGGTRGAAGGPHPQAHDRLRRLRSRPTARSSASATTCPCRLRTSRASGSGASWRSAACLRPAPSSARSCSPAMTGLA